MLDQSKARLQILIVDPEPDGRFILREKLSDIPDFDIRLELSPDGSHAIEQMAKVPYDLVFLSHDGADRSGLELLDQIVQRFPRTAVLMMTPSGDEQMAMEALQKGAIDYLERQALRMVNMRNLLRRVMAKRNLHLQFNQLRKINLLKDDFIGNVSHELRTPLTVILGYARTLLDSKIGPLNEQQRQALGSIEERGTHLLSVVNQLLEFKAAAEGTDRLLLEPLDLRTLVELAQARMTGPAARKELRLAADLPAGEVWVRADRERLPEVLDNLFSNAVKFSPTKGTLTVRLASEGDDAVVTVSDEGPGVPQEKLAHVFEQFSQASQGITREYQGLGLGLALSRQIVDLHGGRIWLRSDGERKGTSAHLSLPLCSPNAPEITIEQTVRLAKRRVLIVEDNPDIVDLIRLFLQNFSPNLHIAAAHNGFEALEYLTHHHPHLMVLDIMMAGMNGFEVIERLRRLPGKQNIPVLVLTGYQDAADKARSLGARAVLLKPFDKNAFIDHVLKLLNLEEPA
ncbi:MAG: response regulator [Elusimicrobia bacterium]|nr:response regulator [Elusimicrobiota bacterium]